MNKRLNPARARYAIDIRRECVHTEFDELDELLAILDDHVGRVRLLDTHSKRLIFHGTTDELRTLLRVDSLSVAGCSFDVGE